MRNVVIAMIVICLLAGCGGGGGGGGSGSGGGLGSGGSSTVTPSDSTVVQNVQNSVQGSYCVAESVNGSADENTLNDAVSFFDSVYSSQTSFLGSYSPTMSIVFDGTSTGYYDYATKAMHLSSDSTPLHRRIVHEFAHAIHLERKVDPDWLLETVAEATEWEFGLESDPPAQLTEEQYAGLETNVDYVTQLHFGCFLMKQYGEDVLYKIISSSYTGEMAVVMATGEPDFQTILTKWKQ